MHITRYADAVRSTADYPRKGSRSNEAISYTALGLAGEVGEVANQVKKIARDDGGVQTPERHAKLRDEIGDVFWYLFSLCDEVGVTPEEAMSENIAKLQKRKAEGSIRGDRREEGS